MHLTPQARKWLRWAPTAFFAVVLIRVVVLAWSATSRGIDFTDEGIYLVSYRYFHRPQMVYNGAPAFFGPVFQAFGYSVAALRRVKVVLAVLSGLALGWSTAAFLRRRPAAVPQLAGAPGRAAVVVLVAVGNFTMYAWLPQTPGYNDLSMLCATVLAATILPVLDGRASSRPVLLAAGGVVLGIAIVNKWPAGITMVIVVAAVLVLAHGWREAARSLALVAGGVFVGCAALALVGGQFFDRLSELRSSSEQLSESLPVWQSYLLPYWRNVVEVIGLVGAKVWLVLVVGVGLALIMRGRRGVTSGIALAGAILLAAQASRRAGLFRGGAENAQLVQVALPLLLVLAAVVWLVAHVNASLSVGSSDGTAESDGLRNDDGAAMRAGGAALALLIGLAGAQAVGTLNPPMFVAVSSGGLVMAATVVILSRSVRLWRPALWPAAALLIVFPVAVERIMQSGLWQHPYRLATNLYAQTEELHDVIGYDGLSSDANTAELLRNLSAIARRRDLVGRPGLSVANSPGYALALGLSQPPADLFVRSAEYAGDNADIYQARLRLACSRHLISSSEPPVILTAGSGAPADIAALLAECGIAFPADFDLEVAESPGFSIGVWIPVSTP